MNQVASRCEDSPTAAVIGTITWNTCKILPDLHNEKMHSPSAKCRSKGVTVCICNLVLHNTAIAPIFSMYACSQCCIAAMPFLILIPHINHLHLPDYHWDGVGLRGEHGLWGEAKGPGAF